ALRRGEAAGAHRPRPRPAAPPAAHGRTHQPPRHRLPAPRARDRALTGPGHRGGAARPEPRRPLLRPRGGARRRPRAGRRPARRGARGRPGGHHLRRRRPARHGRRRRGAVPVPRARRPAAIPLVPHRPDPAGAAMTLTDALDGQQQRWNAYWSRYAAEYDEHQLSRLAHAEERETWSRLWAAALPAGTRSVLDVG